MYDGAIGLFRFFGRCAYRRGSLAVGTMRHGLGWRHLHHATSGRVSACAWINAGGGWFFVVRLMPQPAGTVPGNGGGLVVLKPLEQALTDGDTIHAVVLGSAIANDGVRKVDYLAPGVRGQMHAIGEAWSVAGIEPASLGMIESHGTGTVIGDPIEIRALAQLFAHFAEAGQPPPRSCLIGSVKANIGHLNVASGIAGFIKTVLALREGLIPGTPGVLKSQSRSSFCGYAVAAQGRDLALARN